LVGFLGCLLSKLMLARLTMQKNDRFIRWQEVLREHVTFLNNLLLTISFGVVGFCISLLIQDNFNPFCYTKYLFTFGLGITFISILLGLGTALNRLLDFRKTVEKIKNESRGSYHDLGETKELMELYGKRTWYLFYLQIGTLFVGVLFLILAFSGIFYTKLF